jgi:hemoglobin
MKKWPAWTAIVGYVSRRDVYWGMDEAMIERLIRGFYARVRSDPFIGPVFASRITDWEPHLARMFAFWSSVSLKTRRYSGRPLAMHLPLPIEGPHFDRWLLLFEETARELCPVEAADHFVGLAHQIGRSLEMGIASNRGILLGKDERLGAR